MVRHGQHEELPWNQSFSSDSGSLLTPHHQFGVSEDRRTWGGGRHAITASFLPNAPIKQMLSCSSTGADVKFEGNQGRVQCPNHCVKDPTIAYGASIHPLGSSICLSAIVDGVMPVFGGEMMVTRVRGLPSYVGKDLGYAVSLPTTNQPGEAFTLYPVDNIDLPIGLRSEKKLSCLDTFDKLDLKQVGDMRPVHCPEACGSEGQLAGTNIFTPMSTVCRAAAHAAAIGSEGGHVIVVRGHGQPFFFGSKSGTSAASTDAPGADASYTVSLPVPDVMSRVLKKDKISWAAPKEEMMSPALAVLLPTALRATTAVPSNRQDFL